MMFYTSSQDSWSSCWSYDAVDLMGLQKPAPVAVVTYSGLVNMERVTKPPGMHPAYLVPVPSQDKLGGLWQEGHPA